MADEDLSSQEDEALENAPENDEEAQPDPYAELAMEMGWKPKDQWQGDPEQWKDPKSFILAGRDIQQTATRTSRELQDRLERIERTSSQILSDQLAKRDAEWQAKLDRAVEDDDKAAVRQLIDQKPSAQPTRSGPDPQVAAWIADNPWYNEHPRAKALAARISDDLARQGEDVATQLKEARAEVEARYPELFKAPTKQPPATQTGQNRNPVPSNRAKGFADMPQDSQRMALDYEKHHGVKKEDFARSYWADQASQRSAKA